MEDHSKSPMSSPEDQAISPAVPIETYLPGSPTRGPMDLTPSSMENATPMQATIVKQKANTAPSATRAKTIQDHDADEEPTQPLTSQGQPAQQQSDDGLEHDLSEVMDDVNFEKEMSNLMEIDAEVEALERSVEQAPVRQAHQPAQVPSSFIPQGSRSRSHSPRRTESGAASSSMQIAPAAELDNTTTRTRQDPRTRKETDLDDSIIDFGHQRKQARPTVELYRLLSEVIPQHEQRDISLHEQVPPPVPDEPAVSSPTGDHGAEDIMRANDTHDLTEALGELMEDPEDESPLPLQDADALYTWYAGHSADR
eukprot:9485740-Pyramimonas_sp.AAC.1